MRIQRGPYAGEVKKDGSFTITKEGVVVELGEGPDIKEAFRIMEIHIDERFELDPGARPELVL